MRRSTDRSPAGLFSATEAIALVVNGGYSLDAVARHFAMPVESLIGQLRETEEFIDLTS